MSDKCDSPDVLKRRIQEQNRLIEILTQRNSELAEKNKQQQQLQHLQHARTPRSSRGVAHIQLQERDDQLQLLQRRFTVLSTNHDELTKIKDEYKTRNRTLEAENARLQQENTQLFSSELARRQGQVEALQGQLEDWQNRHHTVLEKLKSAEQERQLLNEQLSTLQKSGSETEAALKARCHETSQLNRTQSERNARLSASCNDLQRRVKSLQEETVEAQKSAEKRCAQLTALAVDRGRQVKERGEEVANLKNDLASMQWRMVALERQAANMRVQALKDAEVGRLTDQLAALRAEYEAYKRHISYQLEQERSLNQKLRHFRIPHTSSDELGASDIVENS